MDYRDLPIVGDTVKDDEWPEIKEMVEEVARCGFRARKVLNFIGGSIKLIVRLDDKTRLSKARRDLEACGWRIVAPYYSHGKMDGFKIAKIQAGSERNAWG